MIDKKSCRTAGAVWAIVHGLVTAILPQLSVKIIKRTIGQNFENADELEAKPAYLRQLRAIGVGLAAAGVTNLLLDRGSRESCHEPTEEPNDEPDGEVEF